STGGATGLGSYAINLARTVNCKHPATFTDGTAQTVILSQRGAGCGTGSAATHLWGTNWGSSPRLTPAPFALHPPTAPPPPAATPVPAPALPGLQNANAKINVPLTPGATCSQVPPSTYHNAGLQACMADGSVKSVSPSCTCWQFAATPAGTVSASWPNPVTPD